MKDAAARPFFVWRHVLSVGRLRGGIDACFAKYRPELFRKVSVLFLFNSYKQLIL